MARKRQVDAGHEDHRLESGEHVARAIGVAGGHWEPSWPVFMAWSMSSASPPAAFADDDSVGPHAEAVADELADRDRAPPSMFGGRELQGDHVFLAELELGRVLDGDDALVVRDERREDVEGRGLARACSTGHEDVQASFLRRRAGSRTSRVSKCRNGSGHPR